MDYLKHNAPSNQEPQDRRRLNIRELASGELRFDLTLEMFNKTSKEFVEEMKDLLDLVNKAIKKNDILPK